MGITNYNTKKLQSKDQFAYWNDAVCNTFTALDCCLPGKISASQAYRASLENWELGPLQLSRVQADPSLVNHSHQLVARSTQDVSLLHMQISGSSLNSQCGHEAVLQPGDFTLCDSTQPYRLQFDRPVDMMVLKIPNRLLKQKAQNSQPLFGKKFSPGDNIGLSPIINNFVSNIWNGRQQNYTALQIKTMADCALSLLSSHFDSYQHKGTSENGRSDLLLGMKLHIKQHLDDPTLCPETVAQAGNISPRYLRVLFAEDGLSCSKYIIKERLELAANLLRQPELQHFKIIDIAFRCGFQDSSHFSRRFSEHFGQSAKQYRQQ